MPKLVVCKGLPGSGKSTWAEAELKRSGNTVRVNRDDLRLMLHHGLKWSGDREKLTVSAERAIVQAALLAHKNVIVDDTNLLGAGPARWEQFAHDLNQLVPSKVTVEIKDFTDVPLSVCIERDRYRTASRVGRGVIERMALSAKLIDLSLYDKVAIVDIDGTLANLDHRLHYLEPNFDENGTGLPKDYYGFFRDVVKDAPFTVIFDAVRHLHLLGHTVIVLSGRPTTTGYDTSEWLESREFMTEGLPPLPYQHLFMRQGGDHRPDNQAKQDIMQMMFDAGLRKGAIKIIIDDRDSVCDVWRGMDLPLVQVNRGVAIQVHPAALVLAIEVGIPIVCAYDTDTEAQKA